MLYKSITSATILLACASAAQIDVDVGEDGLVFDPSTVTAAAGDTVAFHFYPRDHSVVQSTFDSPCKPMSGGFYSGYIPSTSGEAKSVFVVTVNNTDPIWFYCSQGSHCQDGMVGVINPPSSGDTLAEYTTAAGKTSGSSAPNAVAGGIVKDGEALSSSASASASSSQSSTTAAASSSSSSASSNSASSSSAAESASSSVSASSSTSRSASATTSSGTAISSTAASSAAASTGAAAGSYQGTSQVMHIAVGLVGLALLT